MRNQLAGVGRAGTAREAFGTADSRGRSRLEVRYSTRLGAKAALGFSVRRCVCLCKPSRALGESRSARLVRPPVAGFWGHPPELQKGGVRVCLVSPLLPAELGVEQVF